MNQPDKEYRIPKEYYWEIALPKLKIHKSKGESNQKTQNFYRIAQLETRQVERAFVFFEELFPEFRDSDKLSKEDDQYCQNILVERIRTKVVLSKTVLSIWLLILEFNSQYAILFICQSIQAKLIEVLVTSEEGLLLRCRASYWLAIVGKNLWSRWGKEDNKKIHQEKEKEKEEAQESNKNEQGVNNNKNKKPIAFREYFKPKDILGILLVDEGKTLLKRGINQEEVLKLFSYNEEFFAIGYFLADYIYTFPKYVLNCELSTFITSKARQSAAIKFFGLERGLLFATPWAILNATKHTKLEQALCLCKNPWSDSEIKECQEILLSYHRVYRNDRRINNERGLCLPPTTEQCKRIFDDIKQRGLLTLSIFWLILLKVDSNRMTIIPISLILDQSLKLIKLGYLNPKYLKTNKSGKRYLEEKASELREKLQNMADYLRENKIRELKKRRDNNRQRTTFDNGLLPYNPPLPEPSYQESPLSPTIRAFLEEQVIVFLESAITKEFEDIPNNFDFLTSHKRKLIPYIIPTFKLILEEGKITQKQIAERLKQGISSTQISRHIEPAFEQLFSRVEKQVTQKCYDFVYQQINGNNLTDSSEKLDLFDYLTISTDYYLETEVFIYDREKLEDPEKPEFKLGSPRTREFKGLYFDRLRHYLNQL